MFVNKLPQAINELFIKHKICLRQTVQAIKTQGTNALMCQNIIFMDTMYVNAAKREVNFGEFRKKKEDKKGMT